MNQQGISHAYIADILGHSSCAVQGLPYRHRGMEMSATYPALVGPGVQQLPVDMFDN